MPIPPFQPHHWGLTLWPPFMTFTRLICHNLQQVSEKDWVIGYDVWVIIIFSKLLNIWLRFSGGILRL